MSVHFGGKGRGHSARAMSSYLPDHALATDYKLQRYRQTATRTNCIRNSTMVGAVAGTPGTLPTNWSFQGVPTGVSTQVVGTGTTSDGYTFIDIRIFGTNTSGATSQPVLRPEAGVIVAALNGQTWTQSVVAAVLSGPAGAGVSSGIQFTDNVGTNLGTGSTALQTAPIAARSSFSFTASSASTAFVRPLLYFTSIANGAAIDITVRFYAPQLEQAPAPSAFIPTTTAAVSVTETKYVTGPVRTNLMLWSNDLTQSNWVKGSSSLNYALAVATPSGTPAGKLIEDTSGNPHNCTQALSGPSVGTYIFSFTAKAAERTTVYAQISDNSVGGPNATFDLSAGTVTSSGITGGATGFTGLIAQIIPLGNGFYRCIVGGTKAPGANGTAQPNIFIRQNAGYLGDGTSGLYIADTQMEYSSSAITTATAYIGPTNASMNMCCAGGIADLYGYSYSGSGARGEVRSTNQTYLGSELVTNGGFDNGLTGWTYGTSDATQVIGTWDATGKATLTRGSGSNGNALTQAINTVLGHTYTISLDVSGASAAIAVGGSNLGATVVSTGSGKTVSLVAASTGSFNLTIWPTASNSVSTIDNISVKEVVQNAIDYFPAGVPPINSDGYWSRAALTNLVTYSQDFTNAAWIKGGSGTPAPVVTADQVVAPDGSLTADKIVLSAASGANVFCHVAQAITLTAATYNKSIWLRGAVGGEQLYLYAQLQAGGGYQTSARITLTTAWQRFQLPISGTAAGYYVLFGTDLRDTTNQIATAGGTIYAWQAQLVAGTQPGPIIVTQGSVVAIGATTLSIASPVTSDVDFVFYAATTVDTLTGGAYLADMTDGSLNNLFSLHARNSPTNAFERAAGGGFTGPAGTIPSLGRTVSAARWRSDKLTSGLKTGGSTSITAETTALTFPSSLSKLSVGSDPVGTAQQLAPVEFVGVKKGTFSDTDLTNLLTGA